MREIKFRAWNKKYNFMYDNITHYPAYDCNFYYYPERHSDSRILPSGENDLEDVVVMQYTGLKDRNNCDIFEGDIIKVTYDYGSGDHPEADTIHEVVYEYCGFELKPNACKMLARLWMDDQLEFRLEVIGNIYENPELLSTSSKNESE